jgi:hypothetical protein
MLGPEQAANCGYMLAQIQRRRQRGIACLALFSQKYPFEQDLLEKAVV